MKNNLLCLYFGLSFILIHNFAQSVLYPYESEVRETKTLNGLWDFKVLLNEVNLNTRIKESMSIITGTEFNDDTCIKMPVPSSFNDITTSSSIRDHIGWVMYRREFYIPKSWMQFNRRVFVHFGGVHYISLVVINETLMGEHFGGHIPFEVEITPQVKAGLNSIVVFVNNTLYNNSLPQGYVRHEHPDWHPTGFTTYSHNCDYFDYAGINRPVTLFTTPADYICDISVETDYQGDTGYISYDIKICGSSQEVVCQVLIYDKDKTVVAKSSAANLNSHSNGCIGKLSIDNVNLWWPISSENTKSPGYLYTLEVHADDDIYRLPVGIRTIKWTNTSLLINDLPIYLKGFGMHEDSDIRGRGFDNVILARDMNLIKWLGANSFRTSHYPYADETLNEADSNGILVILETPGCSLDVFGEDLLAEHKRVLKEIIDHHKNRPSIIMWSLANEPNNNLNSSEFYFRELVELSRAKDKTRPVTFVTSQRPDNDKAVKLVDIILFNRYNGWYQYSGQLDVIQYSVIGEVTNWFKNFTKPVIITEYGAGSYIGQHELPARMWTEEYQVLLLLEHFKAFDKLRKEGYLIGEMIWNFIDFKVPQEYFRPGKCDKGLFTRDRQPKPAAFTIKERYHSLTEEINNSAKLTTKLEKKCSSFNNIKVDLV